MELIEKYLGEGTTTVKIKSKSDKSSGTLTLKGKTIKMVWKTDTLGRKPSKGRGIETWTLPDEEQAKSEFDDMKERFSE